MQQASLLLFSFISLVLFCKVSNKKVKQYLLFSSEKPNVQYRLKLTVLPLSCQSLICDTKAAEHVKFLQLGAAETNFLNTRGEYVQFLQLRAAETNFLNTRGEYVQFLQLRAAATNCLHTRGEYVLLLQLGPARTQFLN